MCIVPSGVLQMHARIALKLRPACRRLSLGSPEDGFAFSRRLKPAIFSKQTKIRPGGPCRGSNRAPIRVNNTCTTHCEFIYEFPCEFGVTVRDRVVAPFDPQVGFSYRCWRMANSRLHASSSPLSSPTRVHTQVQAHDPNLSGDDEIDSDSPSLIHASPSPSHPNSFEKPLKFPRLVPPISKPNTAGSARTLNNKLPLSASSSDLIDHNKAIGDENDLEFVATDQGEDETVPKEGIQAKVSLSTHNPTIGDVLNHTTPTNLDSRSALQPASSHPGFTGLTTETPPAIPSTMPTTERRTSASPFTPKSTSKSGSNVASTSNPKAASPTHPKGKLHSRRSSKNTTIGVIVDSEPAKGRSRKTATTEVADLVSKGATTNRHTRQSSRKKSTTPAPTPITSTSKHPQGHLRRSSRGTAALVAEFQQEEKPEVLEAIEEQANLEKPRPIKKQGRKGRSKSDLQITSHDGREGHPDGMRQTQAATVGKDHSTPKPPDTIEELDIHSAGEEETGTVGVGRNRELPIAPGKLYLVKGQRMIEQLTGGCVYRYDPRLYS